MVDINAVYQKVLALANKEQRGYITPQEFNLMADKAQLEIFENYFHDMKTAYHKPIKNLSTHSDEISILLEKLQNLRIEDNTTYLAGADAISLMNLNALPEDIYRLDTITLHDLDEDGEIIDTREFTELSREKLSYIQANPLTQPTNVRPVFVREGSNMIRLHPTPAAESIITIYYWRRPTIPHWGFVVVNQKALYNGAANVTTHFELHPSEEENLVTRILELSGIIIEKPQLQQTGMIDKANTIKIQND